MTAKYFIGVVCLVLTTSCIEANWSKGETLFHAARMGNLPEVIFLLNNGVAPDDYKTPSGHTSLIIAVSNNYAEIVDALLNNVQHPADPNARVKIDIVRPLRSGSPPQMRVRRVPRYAPAPGCTALHYAAYRNRVDIIEDLCEHGADPNAQSSRDCDETKEECTWRYRKDVPEGTGLSPLMSSAIANRVEAVKALLENGANIDLQSFTGNTALHYSTLYNDKEVASLLLQYGANASIKNKRGQTAAEIAVNIDSTKVAAIPEYDW